MEGYAWNASLRPARRRRDRFHRCNSFDTRRPPVLRNYTLIQSVSRMSNFFRCICINKLQGVYLCPAVGTRRIHVTRRDNTNERMQIRVLRDTRSKYFIAYGKIRMASLEFRRAMVIGCAPVSRACENSNQLSVDPFEIDRFLKKGRRKKGRLSIRTKILRFVSRDRVELFLARARPSQALK